MNNLNSVLIEGNLVRDPQIRTTPKGNSVCELRVASNRYFRIGDVIEREVSFFTVEVWGKMGESCHGRGKKGQGLRVVGRLRQDRFNGEDGKPQSKILIVAEHVEFRPDLNSHSRLVKPVEETRINVSDYADGEVLEEKISGEKGDKKDE